MLDFILLMNLFLFAVLLYGWMLYTFLAYRRSRQEEVVALLLAATQSQAPMPAVLRASVHDRPQGTLHEFWVAFILFFVLPGYYWFWHRRHNFDQKVLRLADNIEEGMSLHQGMLDVRGVATRETVLAVAVGEATGRLTLCLRDSRHASLAPVLLEVLPRFLYPFLVILAACTLASFYNIFVLPRMQRIMREFHEPLPGLTLSMYSTPAWTVGFWLFVMILGILVPLLIVQLIFIPASRWYFPVLAGVYRNVTLGWAMRMLGSLLEAGMSVPQALNFLINSGYFVNPARQRLEVALEAVEDGASLADALRRSKIIRGNTASLVQAAERATNLPWTLGQLGESRANRAMLWLRRISQVVSPASVIAVGLLVGTLVLAGFMPLLAMLAILSEG
jgi:type II secretory pathway component PulF